MVYDFSKTKIKHKLSQKDFKLILEAYRRFFMFCESEEIGKAYLGFGTHSLYGFSKLFQCVGLQKKGVNNWYTLTNKGIEILEELIKECPIPKDKEIRFELNDYLFAY